MKLALSLPFLALAGLIVQCLCADPVVTFDAAGIGWVKTTHQYYVITPRVVTYIEGRPEKEKEPQSWRPQKKVSDSISDLYDLRLTPSERALWESLYHFIGAEVLYSITVSTDGDKVWSLDYHLTEPNVILAMAKNREMEASPEEIAALCSRIAAIHQAAALLTKKPQQDEDADAE